MKMKLIIFTLSILPLAAYSFGPSGPPGDPSTAMYSISDVCQRLESGAAGEMRVFRGPSSAVGTRSGCNLNELMDKAPAKVADGVNPNEVPAGLKYWGLTDNWGLQTGSMPNHGAKTYVPQAADQGIAAGYYEAGVVKGDANLKPENIRAGVTIFGVVGTYNSVTPSSISNVSDDPSPPNCGKLNLRAYSSEVNKGDDTGLRFNYNPSTYGYTNSLVLYKKPSGESGKVLMAMSIENGGLNVRFIDTGPINDVTIFYINLDNSVGKALISCPDVTIKVK